MKARLLLLFCASCALTTSFDEYDAVEHGALLLYAVRGTIDGLASGTATVVLNGESSVEMGNGPFEFSAALADGADYLVTADSNAPDRACGVTGGMGVVKAGDVAGVAVHCVPTDATLSALSLSVAPLAPAFAPGTLAYSTDPVKTSSILFPATTTTVTATVAAPGATIAIAGKPVMSGVPSDPIPIDIGANAPIDIVVTAADGVHSVHYTIATTGYLNDYIKASNAHANSFPESNFGASVVLDGDTLAVGSPGEWSGTSGINGNQWDYSAPGAGAVYVFVRSAGKWSQQAYIKGSVAQSYRQFGTSVALENNTLVVGAPGEASNTGAAYVFVRNGTTWSEQAHIVASNARASALFGTSVAISNDTMAVGSPGESSKTTGIGGDATDTSAPSAGAAYFYVRSATVWSQQAYVKASNTRSGVSFGASIALLGDRLAVGAPNESSNATGINGDQNDTSAYGRGAVYVFSRSGAVWAQEAFVKPTSASGKRFGAALGLSAATVETLAVGCPGAILTDAGSVFVVTRNGTWSHQAQLQPGPNIHNYGSAVSVVGDMLAVGAPREPSKATGIDGDEKDMTAQDAGAVFVYTRANNAWTKHAYVKASNTARFAQFSVPALSDNMLAVGAPEEAGFSMGINGDQTTMTFQGVGAVYFY